MEQVTIMQRSKIPTMQAHRANRAVALHQVEQHPTLYRPGFYTWLIANYHTWLCFNARAESIRRAGYQTYSARTIIESLRFESDIWEQSMGGCSVTISNNQIPDMARLYNQVHAVQFFKLRGNQ